MEETKFRTRVNKAAFVLVMLVCISLVIKNFITYLNVGCLVVPVEGAEPWPTIQICGTSAIIYQLGLPILLIFFVLVWNPFRR